MKNEHEDIYAAIEDKMWCFLRSSSLIDDNVRQRASTVYQERQQMQILWFIPRFAHGAIERTYKVERP